MRATESTFDFVAYEKTTPAPVQLPKDSRFGHDYVSTFDDLRSRIYAPDPTYNIAEKPWLPGPQTPYLLLNAKLVDPRAGVVHESMSLHLAGGKVLKVAPTTERDLKSEYYCNGQRVVKIDAGGYFVCPGLIDCMFFYQSSNTLARVMF